jgi:hypothetical protein
VAPAPPIQFNLRSAVSAVSVLICRSEMLFSLNKKRPQHLGAGAVFASVPIPRNYGTLVNVMNAFLFLISLQR